jgi:hypothetical protein
MFKTDVVATPSIWRISLKLGQMYQIMMLLFESRKIRTGVFELLRAQRPPAPGVAFSLAGCSGGSFISALRHQHDGAPREQLDGRQGADPSVS